MRKPVLTFGFLLLSVAFAAAQPFSKVIVFGDSNVDSGNYKTLSSPNGSTTYNSYWPAAVAHGAGAPTTNPDPVKGQMLAAFFGLNALPSSAGGTNFATSGAKNKTINTNQTGGFRAAVPTVTQISNFLGSNGGVADPNGLYVVYSGDNDVAYAIGEQGAGPYPADPNAYVVQAANDLAAAIVALKTAGAQKIMVSGLQYSFGTPTLKRTLRLTHSNTLWNALTSANVPFYKADVDKVRTAINANPANFGFTTVSTASPACTTPAGVTTAWALLCSSDAQAPSTWISATAPFTNLYADDEHFATAGQRYFARYFRSLVVPWSVTHDFFGAGKSSVLWRNSNGNTVVSALNGASITSSTFVTNLSSPWTLAGTGDFFSDGRSSLLWSNTSTGDLVVSRMNGANIISSTYVATVPTQFSVAAVGDANSDGKADIFWRDTSNGNVVVSLMNGPSIISSTFVASLPPATWQLAGVGDFNGDGKADILWRNINTGDVVLSLLDGAKITSSTYVANVPLNWKVAGLADFDGDGKVDILWRDPSNGNTVLSLMNGATITSTAFVATVPSNWNIDLLGDFNGDGRSDILWRDSSGNAVVSLLNGAVIASSTLVGTVPLTWTIKGGASAN